MPFILIWTGSISFGNNKSHSFVNSVHSFKTLELAIKAIEEWDGTLLSGETLTVFTNTSLGYVQVYPELPF